ncbi:hypothetical protein [Bradyrhizobium sp. RT5a]|uniref:hypothetical protein n=1 Tax=Bradyrhizobium sp. RT5a TaxID=3156380 RepID=UPI003397DB7E
MEAGKARALEIADVIAPPRSLELGRASVLTAYQTTLHTGVQFERRAIRIAFTTANRNEQHRLRVVTKVRRELGLLSSLFASPGLKYERIDFMKRAMLEQAEWVERKQTSPV